MASLCIYNGVSFVRLQKSSISSRPVLDEAGRAVMYVEHVLTVKGYVTTDSIEDDASLIEVDAEEDDGEIEDTDDLMESLCIRLTRPAGVLQFEEMGFGALHVNGTSEIKDACWGPKPRLLDWDPLGNNGYAAKVVWECVVCIPRCDEARYEFGLMALNYDVTFDRDQDGYEVLRTNGHLLIPLTRSFPTNRTPPDCADAYREKLEGRPPPLGFSRVQTYTVSPDRRRLDFHWTDTEEAVPRPEGVTTINIRHTVRSRNANLLGKLWTVTFSGTVTMGRHMPKAAALGVFLGIVDAKIRRDTKKHALWTHLSIDDDMYGRSTTFTLQVQHVPRADLEDVLSRYGMWQPVAGDTWKDWRAGLIGKGRPWHVRGVGGHGFDKSEDSIIDLCGQARHPAAKQPAPPAHPKGQGRPTGPKRQGPPPPEDAWIDWRCWLEWDEDANVVAHKPLPARPIGPMPGGGPPVPGLPAVPPAGESAYSFALSPFPQNKGAMRSPIPAGGAANAARAKGGSPAAEGKSPHIAPDIIQKVAGASRLCYLCGYGTRVGWQVPVPKLVSVGGVKVVEKFRSETGPIVMRHSDLGPIFSAAWIITYIVPAPPEGFLPVMPSAIAGGGGEHGSGGLGTGAPNMFGD